VLVGARQLPEREIHGVLTPADRDHIGFVEFVRQLVRAQPQGQQPDRRGAAAGPRHGGASGQRFEFVTDFVIGDELPHRQSDLRESLGVQQNPPRGVCR